MSYNVRIVSARYANAENTLVFVLLDTGESWHVIPNNGSGQANVLAAWVQSGNNIGPFVPVVPGGVVPPGSLIWYASSKVLAGWLTCDGAEVKRLQYPKLFAAIGVTFGAGNGYSTFNLPDLRGKFIRGWGAVNSLDPDRVFGSDQESLIGRHQHTITELGHSHGVIDPGHLHVVNDPGHTHVGDDPGHTHAVTDPGHTHSIKMYEDNLLFGVQSGINPVILCPYSTYLDTSGGIPNYGSYSPFTDTASANLTINQGSANLQTAVGQANVSDELDPTFITVNPSVTNITETDYEGGLETRPFNLSLIPYIKY
jgi:microcystin-dependent protein